MTSSAAPPSPPGAADRLWAQDATRRMTAQPTQPLIDFIGTSREAGDRGRGGTPTGDPRQPVVPALGRCRKGHVRASRWYIELMTAATLRTLPTRPPAALARPGAADWLASLTA